MSFPVEAFSSLPMDRWASGGIGAAVRGVSTLVAVLAFHVVQHLTLGDVMAHFLTECAGDVCVSVVAVAWAIRHGSWYAFLT